MDEAPDSPNPLEARLSEPLTETTRRERRALLGFGSLAVFLVVTNGFPSEISVLGAKLAETPRAVAIGMLVVVLYLLVVFALGAYADYARWTVRLDAAELEIATIDERMNATTKEKGELIDLIGPLDATAGGVVHQPNVAVFRNRATGKLALFSQEPEATVWQKIQSDHALQALQEIEESHWKLDDEFARLAKQKDLFSKWRSTRYLAAPRKVIDFVLPILVGVAALVCLALVVSGWSTGVSVTTTTTPITTTTMPTTTTITSPTTIK